MTRDIHKRIDDLTDVVKDMNENQTHERRENTRLMEKLVENQTTLSTQFAEKSAYDRSTSEQLNALWKKVDTQAHTLTDVQIETSANSEARKNTITLRMTIFGIIATIFIAGLWSTWTGGAG